MHRSEDMRPGSFNLAWGHTEDLEGNLTLRRLWEDYHYWPHTSSAGGKPCLLSAAFGSSPRRSWSPGTRLTQQPSLSSLPVQSLTCHTSAPHSDARSQYIVHQRATANNNNIVPRHIVIMMMDSFATWNCTPSCITVCSAVVHVL